MNFSKWCLIVLQNFRSDYGVIANFHKDMSILRNFPSQCCDCEVTTTSVWVFLQLPNYILLISEHVPCMLLTLEYIWLTLNAKNLINCT